MIENAKWIWIDTEENPRNKWVLFKKEFELDSDLEGCRIEITADSRYILNVNGIRLHKGPNRAFPSSCQYDDINIARYLTPGKNHIEVLVNHIGMSTHQYILGRAGLIAGIELKYGEKTEYIYTDDTWDCTPDCGYMCEDIRVSAGQGYSELYKADIGEQHWFKAFEMGCYGMKPWGELIKSILPLPTFAKTSAISILEANQVVLEGRLVNIDLHPIFTGELLKPEFFYLVTNIKAAKDIECRITFPYSRLWCCYGEFMINGREYAQEMKDFIFEPVADGPKTYDIKLNKGDNIFSMRMDNIVMGMHTGMYFDCRKEDIVFESPFNRKNMFCAVTSLLNEDSHYVKLEDGNWINHPRNPDISEDIKEAAGVLCWESLRSKALDKVSGWVRKIDNKSVSSSHPQHSILMQKKLAPLNIGSNIENMIIDNAEASFIEGGHDKNFLIDFGEEVSGYIYIEIDRAEAGEILDFSGFEYRDRYGNPQEMDGVNNGFRYITKKGKQTFISNISRAFRYLDLTIRNGYKISLRHIGIYQSTFPVTKIGNFQCSDYKLNKIYEISERTTRLCMMDTFVDCPGHEQTFWIGDFRNEALISYYLYNSDKIVENGHRVALGALKSSILPQASLPSSPQGIMPTWTLLWLMSFWELYFFHGGTILESYYEEMKQCLEVFTARIKENGLISVEWNDMLDWAPLDVGAGKYTTHLNAEVYLVLKQFQQIASILQKDSDAVRYGEIAHTLKDRIIELLWDNDKAAFSDSLYDGKLSKSFSIQANSMAYMCGCVNKEQTEMLENYLRSGFPESFQRVNSPFASFFYYEALEKSGLQGRIIEDISLKWGEMLDYGATTCFETFPGWEKKLLTRSHCHAWSAAPCYFLPRIILGVRPLESGFGIAEVIPSLGELDWACGSVPVPGGRIDVYVKKEKDVVTVNIKKPAFVKIQTSEAFVYNIKEC